jgi:hypothetical protein
MNMLRIVQTCSVVQNTTYLAFSQRGKPYSAQCMSEMASHLHKDFAHDSQRHVCAEIALGAWGGTPYKCRHGVLTHPTDNWDIWTSIYNRVKATFQQASWVSRVGMTTCTQSTLALGALFGAAAAAVPALLLSLGMTVRHLLRGETEPAREVPTMGESFPLILPGKASKTVLPIVNNDLSHSSPGSICALEGGAHTPGRV